MRQKQVQKLKKNKTAKVAWSPKASAFGAIAKAKALDSKYRVCRGEAVCSPSLSRFCPTRIIYITIFVLRIIIYQYRRV